MQQLSPQEIMYLQALSDEQGRFDGEEGGAIGASAGAILGGLLGTHNHYVGQRKLTQLDKTDPFYRVTHRDNVGNPTAMQVEGAIPRHKLPENRIRPGARMAGSLVGALVGGGLGAGTAELTKRESPSARLLAKIQTQNGRLTPQDKDQLENILTDSYSNMSTLPMM